MNRLLIYEPNPRGHRLQHVRLLLEAVAGLPVEAVVALGAGAGDTDEFAVHLAPALAPPALAGRDVRVDASVEIDASSPLAAARSGLAALRAAVARHRPDRVYVPYADGLAQVAGLARLAGRDPLRPARGAGRPVAEGLLMRGRFAYPPDGPLDRLKGRAWLAATAASPFDVMHHLDPLPHAEIARRGGRLASRSRVIPEPVEPLDDPGRAEARRRLGLPEGGRWVGCVGRLDRRKGIDLLLAAFAEADRAGRVGPDDRMLLMGRADPEVAALLAGPHRRLVEAGRVVVVDRYVSEAELEWGVCALDVVATFYPRHVGSSGVVVRAAAAGRATLGSDYGWIGYAVGRFGLGRTCRPGDAPAAAAALGDLLDASADFALPDAGRRFVGFHTAANYRAHWTADLRGSLGLPPDPALRPWASIDVRG